MNAAFYDAVRETVFGGSLSQPQVEGIEIIQEAWEKAGDGDDFKLAYLLGTAFHETARTMQPVRETLAKTDAKAKEILTKAWKAGKLPWVKSDYWSTGWFGRGYVQLTHKANYEKAGKELGLDLVRDPSKAMIPEVAALILVRGCMEGWFTGRKLSNYITKSDADYIGARKVVNGTDKAGDIAKYATSFYRAMEAARKFGETQYTHSEPAADNSLGGMIDPGVTRLDRKPATPFPDDGLPADPNGLPPAGGNSAGWIVLAASAVSGLLIAGWDWIVAVTGIVSPWW